ncbi:3-hydroxyacyl-CoA dehydrogenase family protein [Ruminococcaceae bacterium OttesenSCG-928-O06]|nr:3-hydroxyacyl-CoA dehydrogenase family protein [Ruminococcaceae bacterium OttesenSCG-928-O06]
MEIKKTACIGSGVIGSSWATNFALKGYPVALYDLDQAQLDLAKERIETNLKYLVKNDVLKEGEVADILGRITYTTSMEEAVKDAQFVQESVKESYDVKHKVIEEFEQYAPADAIYASSTSGLLITEIAKYAKNPERFIGGHPYNPPHLIPLVEMTKGEKTSDEVLQAGKDFFIAIGKEPVILQKEALGFISNRLQMAVTREICELVMRGVCTVEDADKALTFGPGVRWGIMGPCLVFNLGGGKVGIEGLFKGGKPSIDLWLNDMATWTSFPDEWPEIAQKGVNEAIANRPAEIGNTVEGLGEYRDDMLIALLRLHNKL